MVIGGIALATRTTMRAFNSPADAEPWLTEGQQEKGDGPPRPPSNRANASP
jgi:hypothetical protein